MAVLPPEDDLLSNWILRYPISNTTPYGLIYWISKCKQGKAPYWLAQNGQATNRNMESCFGSIHGGLTNKQGGLTLAYSVGASTYQSCDFMTNFIRNMFTQFCFVNVNQFPGLTTISEGCQVILNPVEDGEHGTYLRIPDACKVLLRNLMEI